MGGLCPELADDAKKFADCMKGDNQYFDSNTNKCYQCKDFDDIKDDCSDSSAPTSCDKGVYCKKLCTCIEDPLQFAMCNMKDKC